MFKIIDLFFETKVLDLFRLNLTSVLLLILSMKFYSFKKTIYLSHKLTVVYSLIYYLIIYVTIFSFFFLIY